MTRGTTAAERADNPRRCQAHKADGSGDPCSRWAAKGQAVCRLHGGAAPQARRKAQERLELAADRLAARLLGFALDGEVDDAIALRALTAAMDRAGLTVVNRVAVGPDEDAPWKGVLDSIMGVARTTPDGRPLPEIPYGTPRRALPPPMIDGEVVESPYTPGELNVSTPPLASGNAAEAAEQPPEPQPPVERQPPVVPNLPQRTGLVSLEDALDRQAQQIRRPPR